MGVFERIQSYSASQGAVASEVFDTKTPKGAFLDRVHNAGYQLYSFMYKLINDDAIEALSEDGKSKVSSVIENNKISEETFFSLDVSDRNAFERVVEYSELYKALTTDGNLLVNAIAGGGKSSFLIFKIMYDIVTGESMRLQSLPTGGTVSMVDKVWVCTFLRSGAEELHNSLIKWQRKLGYSQTADQVVFSTLDAEFKRCINAMGVATNIGDQQKLDSLLKRAIDNCNITRGGETLTKEDYKIIGSIVTYRRGRLDSKKYQHVSCEDYGLTPTILDLVVSQFASLRAQEGIMDFDEIQELLYKYLYVTPNKAVQDFVANRYNYIYIDEFQDTSQMQYAILKFYARGKLWMNVSGSESVGTSPITDIPEGMFTAEETKGKIIVIGDPSQCFPTGTLLCETGCTSVRPIEEFKTGDSVRSLRYDGKVGITELVSDAISSNFDGNLVCLDIDGDSSIKATPLHKVFKLVDSSWNRGKVVHGTKKFIELVAYDKVDNTWKHAMCKSDFGKFYDASCWYPLTFDVSVLFSQSSDFEKDYDKFLAIEGICEDRKLYNKLYKEVSICDVTPTDSLLALADDKISLVSRQVKRIYSEHYTGKVWDINTKNQMFLLQSGVLVHNCIYSFKGSDSKILTEYFDSDFRPTHCALSYNYRCPSNILKPIIPSIHKNADSASQNIIPYKTGGEMNIFTFNNYKTMLQHLISEVQGDLDRGMKVAILCRTNFDGIIPAFSLESSRACNFSISSQSMTMNSPLPRKLMNVSSIFIEKSTPAVRETLSMFAPRTSAYNIKLLVDTLKMNNLSIWDIPMEDIDHSCKYLAEFIKGVKSVFMYDGIRHKDKELDALIYTYQWLLARVYKGDSAYSANARAYIETLLYIIEDGKFSSIYEYLDELDVINHRLQGRIGRSSASVMIATVHEFKGKECDSVYVWNDSDGVFPSAKCKEEDEEQLAEERRVHYIACTRAKHKQTILSLTNKLGRFVQEMDAPKSSPVTLKKTLGV